MSRWSIFWAGLKGFFTPGSSVFVSIVQLGLDTLNTFMAGENIASKIAEGYRIASSVLALLIKYADWCPIKWREQYDATIHAVNCVVSAFEDGKVELAEITAVTEQFQIAYAIWSAD